MLKRHDHAQIWLLWYLHALWAGLAAVIVVLFVFVTVAVILASSVTLVAKPLVGTELALAHWLVMLAGSRLFDPSTPTPYLAAATYSAVGLAWSVVYGRWYEPYLSGPCWQRGALVALVAWVLSSLVLFPMLGMGPLGFELGAGPLPVIGSLLLHLIYGAGLGLAYEAVGDRQFLIAAPHYDLLPGAFRLPDGASAGRGLIVGGLLGATVGLLSLSFVRLSSDRALLELPAALWTFVAVIAGGVVGSIVLPSLSSGSSELADAEDLGPLARRRGLRVVDSNGCCPRGYEAGDTFTCTAAGEISPPLCPLAAAALQPLLAAMVAGEPGAPERVCCPIHDHMLVLQLDPISPQSATPLPPPVTQR
ncbi:MAG: hypothetical protein HY329_12085 [Chloroflexi bacterium]|nr:hypothetical protein [Chloroflexota bacterium]